MSEISIQSTDGDSKEPVDTNYGAIDDYMVSVGTESHSYIQHKDFAVKFLQTKQPIEPRPIIPATWCERFSFLRAYMCSPLKHQMFFIHRLNFNEYFWDNILQVFLIDVPYSYTVLFLSIYSPQNHFYSSKMFPLFWGCSLQVIIAGLLEMCHYGGILTFVFDYAVMGVLNRAPWNRCDEKVIDMDQDQVNCYELDTFYTLTNTNGTKFDNRFYELNGSYFHNSQLLYFMVRIETVDVNLINFYYSLIWIAALLFHRQIFKIYLWRAIDYLIWTMCLLYFLAFCYIEVINKRDGLKHVPPLTANPNYSILIATARLGLSMTGPSVLHLLNARSSTPVQPRRDSYMYGTSNNLFNFFQGIVYYRLKRFCESKTGIPILTTQKAYPLFYLWPMFFKTFSLGPFFSKFFFILLFLTELVIFIIMFQALVEMITCEWPKLKGWMVVLMLTGTGFLVQLLIVNKNILFCIYIYAKVLTTMTELAVIHWLYPVGRLMEDIKFFNYGDSNPYLQNLILKLLPYYFLYFTVYCLTSFSQIYLLFVQVPLQVYWIWTVPLWPIFFGAIYISVKTICIEKKKWNTLLRPEPSWGPRDHLVRQLRKHFDSEEFIDSLGPRFLNRHMRRRAEPPTYRLGVQYDPPSWRSTARRVVPIKQDKAEKQS